MRQLTRITGTCQFSVGQSIVLLSQTGSGTRSELTITNIHDETETGTKPLSPARPNRDTKHLSWVHQSES